MSRTRPRARRRIAAALAVVALIAGALWWRIGGTLPALELVDATVERSDMTLRFTPPARSEPALVRVGTPPTPIDVTAACETAESVIVFLYESGSALRLVEIDKASGAAREIALDGAELTYHPRADRREPGVVWVPTAQAAALFRYDARDGAVRKVLDLPEESHVFGFDQDDAGTLYLGTHPGARCLRVDIERDVAQVREIEVDVPDIAGASYLRGIFATDDALLLYYMSPAVVVRYDLATGRSGVLAREAGDGGERGGKLRFRAEGDRLRVSSGGETWHFDRRGPCEEPGEKGERGIEFKAVGDRAEVTWAGGRAAVSLLPRAAGMRITCLRAGGDGAVYGSTYWNTWLFRIDPETQTVTGLGALPEASGEFFTVGWWRNQLVIPHYQGALFLFDPARPFSENGNPRLVDTVPGAHFGLSCVTDADDRIVYATVPNYDQPRGMLVVREADGTRRVHGTIGDGLTLGNLVSMDAGVFGSTIERYGLGLRGAEPEEAPPLVVRLDVATGRIVESVEIGAPIGRDVYDLVAAGEKTLLALSKHDIHRIDITPDGLRTVNLRTGRLRRDHDEMVALLVRDEHTTLVLTRQRLAVIEGDRVRGLCRLPIEARHFTADGHGNVWMAEGGRLFMLPAGAVTRLIDAGPGPAPSSPEDFGAGGG